MGESNYGKDLLSRRLTRRALIKAGAAGLTGLAGIYISGCLRDQQHPDTTGEGAKEPKYGGVLRVGRSQGPPHLDPALSSSHEAVAIYANTYSRLIRLNCGPGATYSTEKLVPELAEFFEQPDETTYVFYLHKGIKFHDKPPLNGRELTADDVKYTFERLAAKTTGGVYADLFAMIEKIEVPDRYTLKIKIKEPFVPFLNHLSDYFSSWIIPKEVVEKFGDLRKNAIGTGPFVLESWERNKKAVFKRNPEYFQEDLPYLDAVEYLYIPDQETRTQTLISGQIDLLKVTYAEVEAIKAAIPDVRLEREPSALLSALILQASRPPFNDKRVRQAIKSAVDIAGLISTIYGGDADWGSSVPPVLAEWALPQSELQRLWKQDLERARQLMAEAGLADGFKTTIYISTAYDPTYQKLAEALTIHLQAINIEASVQNIEFSFLQQALQNRDFEMYLGPRTASTEVDEYLYASYHSKGIRNLSRGNDLALDFFLTKQRSEFNEEERVRLVKEIQRLLADLVFDIPLPTAPDYVAMLPHVQDYQGSLDAGVPSFSYVWLEK